MRIFIIGLFILYSFSSGKPTNLSSVGIAAGSHGWGISYKRILKSQSSSELNFEIRFYDVKGSDEFVFYNYPGGTETINENSLVLIPVFGGWKYYPFVGKIENNFSPFLTLKAGPLFIFDGNEDISLFFLGKTEGEEKVYYTDRDSRIGFGLRESFRDLTIVSYSILVILDNLRSSNRGALAQPKIDS